MKGHAQLLLGYLDVRFNRKYGKVDQDAELNVWTEELEKLKLPHIDHQTLKEAVDLWAATSPNGRPPTVDQYMNCLKKIIYAAKPKLENKSGDTVYGITARNWDMAKTDEQKRDFFRALNKRHLSPATRWVIKDWLIKKGIDDNKIRNMLYI